MGSASMEKKLIFSFIIFISLNVSNFAQKMYNENKSRLETIKLELEKKNSELKEYNQKYEKLLIDMQKLKSNEKNISEKRKNITLMMEKIKKEMDEVRNKYNMLKESYTKLQNEINNDITSLYLSKFSISYFYRTDKIIVDMIKRNMIINKSTYAKAINNKSEIFSKNLTKLSINREKYSKEINIASKNLEENRKELKKNEKELYLTDAKLKELQSEIEELNRTARNLSNLIKKIEKTAPYKTNTTLSINLEKKSLPWPMDGVVVKKFGKEYIDKLKTWVINDGIKIKSDNADSVRAVMSGKVVYSGEFRGFGNLVIIDHGDNIFSTYGFLNQIYVSNAEDVAAGVVIGKPGTDPRDLSLKGNVLYFEIRKGEAAVDPLDYLR